MAHMCGRRAPEGSGSAPSIEQLGGQLYPPSNRTIGPLQEIDAAVRSGAVRALRRCAGRQFAIAQAGRVSPDHFPSVIVATGESAIAFRLATALTEAADELEAEGSA